MSILRLAFFGREAECLPKPLRRDLGDVDKEHVGSLFPSVGQRELGRKPIAASLPQVGGQGRAVSRDPHVPAAGAVFEEAMEAASEGAEYAFPEEYRQRTHGPHGWVNCNLRTKVEKIIRRAALEPWPKLWHSLPASCESDLAQEFPLAMVTKRLGNAHSVALRHFVDTTDDAFRRALEWTPAKAREGSTNSDTRVAKNPAQHVPAPRGKLEKLASEALADCRSVQRGACRNSLLHHDVMEDRGLEPLTS